LPWLRDEARKLAERTGNATREITEMIERIQVETKIAVTAMRKARRKWTWVWR
jgi:methyl-accepting chemotaxis protein